MGSICNEKLLESGGMHAAVYGCITGEEVRTRVGYSGGSKLNPDNYSIGHHPECIEMEESRKVIQSSMSFDVCRNFPHMQQSTPLMVTFFILVLTFCALFRLGTWLQVEYDPKLISYARLLDVLWANHNPTRIFGKGPDVGPQ